MNDTRFLDRRAAAQYLSEHGLKTAPSTLAKLFSIGGGPEVRHFGKKPLYEPAALDAWAAARLTRPRRNSSEPVLA